MPAVWEIERRYLVRVDAAAWQALGKGYPYRQGYVRTGNPSVRIRIGEPRGPVLALKSGRGIRRREIETVVPLDVAEALIEASEKRVIEKVRWVLGPWELDRFSGPLEGLTLLEIELDHEEDPIPDPPTGVRVLLEVTDDNRFTNSALARLKKKEQARLVDAIYREVEG